MRFSATVDDRDLGMEDLRKRIEDEADHVDIGVHSDEAEALITIAAANEYGATINHPGGQPFIIVPARARGGRQTRKQRSGFITLPDGSELIFLRKGQKGMGVTKPHTITIPERSYIRSTMDENQELYQSMAVELVGRIIEGSINRHGALTLMGQVIETDIKNKIRTLRSPPNAPSTIARKGSDNPLIDNGLLVNSIRFEVKPAEGGVGAPVDAESG